MKQELETELFLRILNKAENVFVRDIIHAMLNEGKINNPKQAWYTLSKWDKRGIYNYGTSFDLGCLEPDAVEMMFPKLKAFL